MKQAHSCQQPDTELVRILGVLFCIKAVETKFCTGSAQIELDHLHWHQSSTIALYRFSTRTSTLALQYQCHHQSLMIRTALPATICLAANAAVSAILLPHSVPYCLSQCPLQQVVQYPSPPPTPSHKLQIDLGGHHPPPPPHLLPVSVSIPYCKLSQGDTIDHLL